MPSPIPPPANHPPSCGGCSGSGYMPGAPIPGRAGGQEFEYSTVTTCTHPWWDDEPEPELEPAGPPWVAAGVTVDDWLASVRAGN